MAGKQGRSWTDEDVIREITQIKETLGIDYFPSKSQIRQFTGSESLPNKVTRGGGSRYYASIMGLSLSNSESEFGNFFEEFAIDDIKANTGFDSVHTLAKHPYDVLTDGCIKVDVKVSKKLNRKGAEFPYYSFNLEKRDPTCDLFILYCLDRDGSIEKTVVIPSCICSGKTQIGIGGLSHWDAYCDRWDYFDRYKEFYDTIKGTAIFLPKRRSKAIN